MTAHQHRKSAAAAFVGIALLAASAPEDVDAYTGIVAFGDSLSDNGNLYNATGQTLPPAENYFQGRFSNGRVAVEFLAAGLGLGLANFAYGGAETGLLNGAMVAAGAPAALQNTGLSSQLGFYQASLGPAGADADALYMVWGGANDFQYRGYTPAVGAAAIQNLGIVIQSLYALGARSFLVPGLPDLGATPAGLASGASAQLQQLSAGFNFGLTNPLGTGMLDQLRALPGAQITYFDVASAQHELIDNPARFGLTNVTDGCFSGFVDLPGVQCSDPSSYLYWDSLHPTTQAHEVLGLRMLAAVPEPQALLLMAMGTLALLVATGRRGRRPTHD